MDVAVEMEDQNAVTSCPPSENDRSASTPDVPPPPENHDRSPTYYNPHFGTVIRNRIFVGGLDNKVKESDLRHAFSEHGPVKDVKIVTDHLGMSKGYGFVTFKNQDDALKVLHVTSSIFVKDKKLSIGQAVRKQQTTSAHATIPEFARPTSRRMPLTTSTGCPYFYINGAAYFHCPGIRPPAHYWPTAPPLVMRPQSPQPFYRQPAYYHHPDRTFPHSRVHHKPRHSGDHHLPEATEPLDADTPHTR